MRRVGLAFVFHAISPREVQVSPRPDTPAKVAADPVMLTKSSSGPEFDGVTLAVE
jgi:hypothetical protein